MEKDIKVSVICNTYNQENYIRNALDGFVMQKTNFDFEILVHDDASTDKTPIILKEYEKKFPNLIKVVYEKQNKYSLGVDITDDIMIPMSRGKYIALCEGDDYWNCEYKLQKQFDAMEQNPNIDMCAHGANVINIGNKKTSSILPSNELTIISTEEVILGGGGHFATNSLFYRKDMLSRTHDFYKKLSLDYSLQIEGSLKNGILFFPDCMSTYRSNSIGSWSKRMANDLDKNIKTLKRINDMLAKLNEDTERNYEKAINIAILKNELNILDACGDYKAMKSKKYYPIVKKYNISKKIKFYIKVNMPLLLKIKRKMLGGRYE